MSARGLIAGVSALGVTALAAAVLAAGAVGATSAPRTTEPVQIYPVDVRLSETNVKFNHFAIPFDAAAQFRIRNTTRANRTFSIGGQRVVVRARGARILIIIFEIRGRFPYVSAGPKGTKPVRGVLRVI
jgi:hypothetical protein